MRNGGRGRYGKVLAAALGVTAVAALAPFWNTQLGASDKGAHGVNEIHNGPTLLFHDAGGDRSQTVAALREVLPWLKQQGYSFGFPVR